MLKLLRQFSVGLLLLMCVVPPLDVVGGSNNTCEGCWGRGTLRQSSSARCVCTCETTVDSPARDGDPVREFSVAMLASPLRLLPPTCRYAETENIRLRLEIEGNIHDFDSFAFMRAIRRHLVLKFADQTVLISAVPLTESTFEVLMDIRDDGSGNELPKDNADADTNWAFIHFRALEEAVRVQGSWGRELGIRMARIYVRDAAVGAEHGGQELFSIAGYSFRLETVAWLASPLLCMFVLLGIEFSFTDTIPEAESKALFMRERAMSKSDRAPVAAGSYQQHAPGGTTPHNNGADADVRSPADEIRELMDEDGFELPVVAKQPSFHDARRRSQADAYQDYSKNFYGSSPTDNNVGAEHHGSDTPNPPDQHEPEARRQDRKSVSEPSPHRGASMRKKSYYYV